MSSEFRDLYRGIQTENKSANLLRRSVLAILLIVGGVAVIKNLPRAYEEVFLTSNVQREALKAWNDPDEARHIFIVGKDGANVGSSYTEATARRILRELQPGDKITAVYLDDGFSRADDPFVTYPLEGQDGNKKPGKMGIVSGRNLQRID